MSSNSHKNDENRCTTQVFISNMRSIGINYVVHTTFYTSRLFGLTQSIFKKSRFYHLQNVLYIINVNHKK